MTSVEWEPVIGLEIHVQLKTETKMFCRCANEFGAPPNTHTCPVCLAFPGALPVPNRRAIEETIKLGVALDCKVAERAVFHRKNYFYPDLPKAYQISQYDEPLCADGSLTIPTEDGDVTIGIVRAHLEEDAAKSMHVAASGRIHGATATLVDFNRGGTPLVEIVTAPDLRDADTAKRFLQLLRQTVVELGLSDAELEMEIAYAADIGVHCGRSRSFGRRQMPETMLSKELDQIIADHQLRIQQQRIHVRELSGDHRQQQEAQGQLTAMVAGLEKLRDYRKLFG